MMVSKIFKKKKKKDFFFSFVFSHPGGSVSLPGVWESGFIPGRLPDDPGGFTCMLWSRDKVQVYSIGNFSFKSIM